MKNFDTRINVSEISEGGATSDNAQKLLFLMPLVQTAWAHGAIALREKHLIFAAAREDGVDERSELNLRLDELLLYQPSRQFFADCLAEIERILSEMTVSERERLASKIAGRCRQVAASAGGSSAMDVSAFVSPEERQTLFEIGDALGIRPPSEKKFAGFENRGVYAR